LAGAAGYYVGISFSDAKSSAFRVQSLSEASDAIAATRSSASGIGYEAALWHFLELLRAESESDRPMLEGWVIATDRALTYARLADVAAQQGLPEKSELLLAEAVAQCPKMRLRDCSEMSILKMARGASLVSIDEAAATRSGGS
jgi:hypothetical protein